MIVLDKKVLRHLDSCGECSCYNEGYTHLYPERSNWSFEQELIHAMQSPIDDTDHVRISEMTF